MTQRTIVLAPGEPRWVAWLFHQQIYWTRCRWFGHRGDRMCTRCGTQLKRFEVTEGSYAILRGLPEDMRPFMLKMLNPDTITVGRP